jgi:hypothetical protein
VRPTFGSGGPGRGTSSQLQIQLLGRGFPRNLIAPANPRLTRKNHTLEAATRLLRVAPTVRGFSRLIIAAVGGSQGKSPSCRAELLAKCAKTRTLRRHLFAVPKVLSKRLTRGPKAIQRGESVYPGMRAVKPTLIDRMKKLRHKFCYPVPGHGKSEYGFG